MSKRSILIHLDCDEQPSVFDSVVAVDSGVEVLLRHGGVKPIQVRDLVHGAIFTRGVKDLRQTAIFVGGSNVEKAQELHEEVRKSLIPQYGLTVSNMMDANGCNTTAVAAVRALMRSMDCSKARALVLAGTGPVGQRVASLLARLGCSVKLASRQLEKAQIASEKIKKKREGSSIEGVSPQNQRELSELLDQSDILVGCGAAGSKLVDQSLWIKSKIKVAVDLNGVPPVGIEGINSVDKDVIRGGIRCYGALGVGSWKMKLHRKCISALFESNHVELDEDTIFDLSESIGDSW